MRELTQEQQFIIAFDKSFRQAIVNPQNIAPNGAVDWDFVDADVYMDMCRAFGNLQENTILHDLYYSELDQSISDQIECEAYGEPL